MMKKTLLLSVSLALLLVIVGCGPSGGSSDDSNAAQSFLPTISGYSQTNADSITDAITTAGGGAAILTGNAVAAAAVAQIDSMVQCYQNVGAVAANVYTQANLANIIQGEMPRVGAVAVVNQDRLANNLLNCALGGQSQMRMQSAAIEPCAGSGNFTSDGQTLHYLYAGTDPEFCSTVQQHFAGYGG